ncbi:MAG TPA: hypothetical protein VFH10_15840 [Nocardioides sp.]|uniref:hypothetical protein n=1 Tax=Nocardioides sp. TaxID=35761 RepID=UPI002D7E645F|nr:hypothetical protein [Nocardioides sp.]HET6654110.1 hypothetical protein [Nocardioides sp.]
MAALLLSPTTALVVAAHLGGLHPYENALVLAIAFGPFIVLGIVVTVLRRRDVADESKTEKRIPD